MVNSSCIPANLQINNDLVIHRQVKTSNIISRHFGDFMTPLSKVQMRIKLTNGNFAISHGKLAEILCPFVTLDIKSVSTVTCIFTQ